MEPMFIDFRGHIIKIVEKEGKRTAVMSNKEELDNHQADMILLDQDPATLTENVYNGVMNKVFNDIKGDWEQDLKKHVMKILGFSDSWNKWEIDHCNGRMSQMSELISAEVKKLMLEQLDPSALTLTDKEKEELSEAAKKDLVKDFQYQYNRAFERAMEAQVRAAAEADAKAQFEEFIKDKKGNGMEVIRLMNYRLNNPRY